MLETYFIYNFIMLCGIFFAFVKENTHSIIFKVASSLMLVFVIWIRREYDTALEQIILVI